MAPVSGARIYRGEMMQGETPEWQPLLDAVGEELTGDFMWMFEVRLLDGTPLQAYKHIDSRRYLHLAPDGAGVGARLEPSQPHRIHRMMCMLMCMRTNIDIDDEIMREAQLLTGARTKREAVDLALRELVARHRRLGILELRGRVHWEGDLSATRRGRA